MNSRLPFALCGLGIARVLCCELAVAEPALAPSDSARATSETSAPESPVLAAPSSDAARKAEAEGLRLRALQHYDAHEYRAAREDFERANQLLPSFRLLYNLGVVSLALADAASAYDYFQRGLVLGGAELSEEKRSAIERQLQELEARTALLTVAVDTPGALVLVGDLSLGNSPLGRAIRLNPGPIRVVARLPDGRNAEKTVVLVAGQASQLGLALNAPTAILVHPTAPRPQRPLPWVGWTTTVVLATGATIAGIEALSAQHDHEQAIANIGASRAELDRLDTRATRWSVAADTLTTAAIVVGAYSLYLTLRRAPVAQSAHSTSGAFSPQLQSQRAGLTFSF